MAGRPGRSGGWNRKSLQDHVLAGTYRKCRHGPLPGHVHPIDPLRTDAGSAAWMPAPDEVKALAAAGRVSVQRMLAEYDFHLVEGMIVLEVAHTTDRLADVRRQLLNLSSGRERERLSRLELALSHHKAALLGQLQIPKGA